jgi:hypothetical protein
MREVRAARTPTTILSLENIEWRRYISRVLDVSKTIGIGQLWFVAVPSFLVNVTCGDENKDSQKELKLAPDLSRICQSGSFKENLAKEEKAKFLIPLIPVLSVG